MLGYVRESRRETRKFGKPNRSCNSDLWFVRRTVVEPKKPTGIHKKQLSKAEREFKVELGLLKSNIPINKYSSSPQSKRPNQRRLIAGRRMSNAEDDEMSHFKSSIAMLYLVNSENTKKVKLVDSTLRNRESSS
ncbi:hypothetical protein Hanom_Chr02g00104551 [Helianthus anomalus]